MRWFVYIIHGHLAHDVTEANMLRWFVYLIKDLPCKKAIVGSTTKPISRWSGHKSDCNNGPSNATLKDIGAFSFLELNKGIIQMQVTIKLTR